MLGAEEVVVEAVGLLRASGATCAALALKLLMDSSLILDSCCNESGDLSNAFEKPNRARAQLSFCRASHAVQESQRDSNHSAQRCRPALRWVNDTTNFLPGTG